MPGSCLWCVSVRSALLRRLVVWALALVFIAGAQAADGVGVSGAVKDPSGAAVPGAQVSLQTAQQVILGSARTDSRGRFTFDGVLPGSYVLVVESKGFAEQRVALQVGRQTVADIEIALGVQPLQAQVSVTAHLSRVEEAETVSQPVNVIEPEAIRERARTVVAQVAEEEVGVHLQRTSPTVAGIFVRGLTGNKVNVFIDGVRYSNGAQRGGINTFLDLIQPENLQAVEILRGPNSVQYGSDALGGSVQFVSRNPSYSSGPPSLHGSYGTFFDSATAGFGSNFSASLATKSFGVLTNFAGQRSNRLRPGQGLDSHSAFTRFFGLPSDRFLDSRLPDTAFTQYGGLVRMNWDRYEARESAPYTFDNVEFEAVQLVPALREQYVFAFRVLATATHLGQGSNVPFALLPTIGGGDTVRGYFNRRLADRSRALATAEYRWRPSRYVDMAIFLDSGTVAPRLKDIGDERLITSWGIGARLHGPNFTALRIEAARGHEGWALVFSSGQPF